MVRLYSIGRFIGPWLAYAALSGLAVAFVLGALVTIGGLVAGIFMVFGAGSIGNFIREIVKAFPEYALIVLTVIAAGFCGGFINGLLAALVGGKVGQGWSFVFITVASFYLIPVATSVIAFYPILAVGNFGVLFPRYYLSETPLRYEMETPLRDWLRGSWLAEPPQLARLGGILLPVTLCMAFEFCQIAPVFIANKNYVARIGVIETWQNSRRIFVGESRRYRSPVTSCQSNLKQIMLGVMQYSQDYDEYYPPKLTDPSNGVMAALYPYLKSTQVFQCPTEFYSSDSLDFKNGDFTDYYFNSRLFGLSESGVTNRSTAVALGDGNTGSSEANSAYSLGGLPPVFPPAMRHLYGANYAFIDGHVKWLQPTRISNSATTSGYSFVP